MPVSVTYWFVVATVLIYSHALSACEKKILHFRIDVQSLEPLTIYSELFNFFIQTPAHVHLQT
jgi:hypothetical protein